MLTEQDLLRLKKKVEAAKTNVSELRRQEQAQLNNFKVEWGVKTVEQAENEVKSLNSKKLKLDSRIEKGCEELEINYGDLIE